MNGHNENCFSPNQRWKTNLVDPRENNFYRHSSSARDGSDNLSSIFPCQNPCTPHMADVDKRCMSYGGWPNHIRATPRQLAEAGFVYLGNKDRTKCFYCDGGLQHWKYNEDPWFEHAKWYPNCDFVLRNLGIDYVQRVASQFPNINRPLMPKRLQRAPKSMTPSPPASIASSCSAQANESGYYSAGSSSRSQAVSDEMPFSNSNPVPYFEKKLSDFMESYIVQETIPFGFNEDLIRSVVAKKLKSNSEYSSVSDLVNDLLKQENSSDFERMETNEIVEERKDFSYEASETDLPCSSGISSSPNYSSSVSMPPESNSVESDLCFANDMSNDDVQRKIDDLVNEERCKICLDQKINCVFTPCGHACCCLDCGPGLTKCPICRKSLETIIRFYR